MEVRMSLAEAAALTGAATNTIRSRFKAGKIRGERDNAGKIWVWIDPSMKGSNPRTSNPSSKGSNDAKIEALTAQIISAQMELDALRPKAARTDLLEAEKSLLTDQLSDLKLDRDSWRQLAERLASTDTPKRSTGFLKLFRR